MKPTIKHLIAEGKTKQAIELLLTKVQSSPDAEFQNNITLLSGRFYELESKKHARTITDDAYNAERVRINEAILHYAEEIENKNSENKRRKIGLWLIPIIGLIASMGIISKYALKDDVKKENKTEGKKEIEHKADISKPDTTAQLSPKKEIIKKIPKSAAPKIQPTETAPKNHFESKDNSKQVNIPDNKGVININQ